MRAHLWVDHCLHSTIWLHKQGCADRSAGVPAGDDIVNLFNVTNLLIALKISHKRQNAQNGDNAAMGSVYATIVRPAHRNAGSSALRRYSCSYCPPERLPMPQES